VASVTTLRFDHVGVVVEDLDAVTSFFLGLGFERAGAMRVDGEIVDRINGLDGVQAELVMLRTPDRTGTLEVVKYHAPAHGDGTHPWPANRPGFRHICLEIDDVHATLDRLRGQGYDAVGEAQDYGGSYRLCYVRGPEGLIIELAQRLGAGRSPSGTAR
jgi:catechol 2,3-dioxygenase-like lactoylglutathione lyase family enzyme